MPDVRAVVADRSSDPESIRSEIRLPAEAWSAGIARTFARAVVRPYGTDVDTIELVVSELVTNAIRATRAMGAQSYDDRPITLDVTATARWVRIAVTDPDRAPIDVPAAGLLADFGRGLGIVDTLTADRTLEYGESGKTMTCTIAAPGIELTVAERAHIREAS